MSPVLEGSGRARRPGGGIFCVVLAGLTLAALGHVAMQAKMVEVAALLGKQQSRHRALLEERRHLEVELGRLKDPARLVRLAQEELGMTNVATAIRPAPMAATARPGRGAR